MRQLSDRQERMRQFIEVYADDYGRPSPVHEIAQAAGISSTSVVDYNLRVLEREGLLNRSREVSRGIELPNRKKGNVIFIRGEIAAGQPIDAIDNPTDTVEVP